MSHAHAYPVHVTSSTINTTHNTQRKCSSRPCEYMLRSHPNGILSVALWSFQWIMDTLCIIINLCGTLAKQNRTKKNFNITFFFSFCHSDAIFLACRTYFSIFSFMLMYLLSVRWKVVRAFGETVVWHIRCTEQKKKLWMKSEKEKRIILPS